MKKQIKCPHCSAIVETYKNPIPTVDIIIRYNGKFVLIKRGEPPYGLALPGGYVEYGETLETAAAREAYEETGLELENIQQFKAYSDPNRDARQHNISIVFHADGLGTPQVGSDAREVILIAPDEIDKLELAFDHKIILTEYLKIKSPTNNQ
ncbi:MAG: NUDIX hydrolase [candidate division Zixibacteria bacterium]|nr:NUDIX hydrolase [Candidatus Tariuqbacter arcticus]